MVYLYYETAKFVFIPEVNCKGKLLVSLDYLEVREISSLHQEICHLVTNHVYRNLLSENSLMNLKSHAPSCLRTWLYNKIISAI